MNKNNVYKINYLSTEFFEKYTESEYPEIENKSHRPYLVLMVKIGNNNFAIPFRTNIKHNNAYKFKTTNKDTKSSTGLDYSKAVIVNDKSYIGESARIDDKEYLEINNKYWFIIKQLKKYVNDYIKYKNGNGIIYDDKKFKYTSLKYFHKELNIK